MNTDVGLADDRAGTSAGLTELVSLRMLVQACFGALIGVLIAMALAQAAFPRDGPATSVPPGLLHWTLPYMRIEPREKGFYLLSLFLGPLGGVLATGRLFTARLPFVALGFALIATIPLDNAFARRTLQGHLTAWIGVIVAILLTAAFVAALRICNPSTRILRPLASEPIKAPSAWTYAVLIPILAIIVIPTSFVRVAANIGLHETYVSFLIGPSLYFLGHNLIPGIDYYTQYSIGEGWLFSFFLGNTTDTTLVHYVIVVIIAILLFYIHLIRTLIWLYRSWIATTVVTFLSLILLFHTTVHFIDPSATVLRYPLLTVCAALLARWVAAPRDQLRLLSLALAVAGALFLETETGIITACAVALSFIIVSPRRPATLLPIFLLGTASLGFFAFLILLVFGHGALTLQFLAGLIEPLMIYGVMGFGGWPIWWSLTEWNWLYNFVAPGLALATLGSAIRAGRDDRLDRPRTAVLVYFAVSGLLMMAKFINMSVVAVWQMNAVGLFIVMGWWGVAAMRAAPRIVRLGALPIPVRLIAMLAMLISAVALASTSSDRRNPTTYGLNSWLRYPALALAPFRSTRGCASMECVSGLPDPVDVALIRERTKPHDQVAIIGGYTDWTYLIDAHRPPAMAFLPSFAIFTDRQIQESLNHLATVKYCFIIMDPKGAPFVPNRELSAAVMPVIKRDFVPDGVGKQLAVWKRVHRGDELDR